MVGGGIAFGLSILSHDVADIGPQGGVRNGVCNTIHQQVWDHTGIETARPQQNEIRPGTASSASGLALGRSGTKANLGDPAVLCLFKVADFGFPGHTGSVFKLSHQLNDPLVTGRTRPVIAKTWLIWATA